MFKLDEALDTTYVTEQYNEYLSEHIANVRKGYGWLRKHIPGIDKEYSYIIPQLIYNHDISKYSEDEYMPYANYFYGKKSEKSKTEFNYAWNHHIHNNRHHWQHWLLQNDEDGLIVLDMPYPYIVEMVCDHWAFSWKSGNLYEIFSWYSKNKNNINLSEKSRAEYENILNQIKKELDKQRDSD